VPSATFTLVKPAVDTAGSSKNPLVCGVAADTGFLGHTPLAVDLPDPALAHLQVFPVLIAQAGAGAIGPPCWRA